MTTSENKTCCTSGHLHAGTPKGSIQELNGISTYTTSPSPSSNEENVIVLLSDVFGHEFPNLQLLADQISLNTGLTVYAPDIFNKDPLSYKQFGFLSQDANGFIQNVKKYFSVFIRLPCFGSWMSKHGDSVTSPIVNAFLDFLLEKSNVKRIALYGFCFGGRYAVLQGSLDKVKVVLAAHPSLTSVPKDYETIKVPTLILCPETDFAMGSSDQKKLSHLLESKENGSKAVIYEKVQHGFSLKGNQEDPIVKKAADDALEEACNFIKLHLLS